MRASAIGLAACLTMLAGCAGGVTYIPNVVRTTSYDPSVVQYAARSGAVPVVVRGHPFGPDDAGAIVAALPPLSWLGGAGFAPSPTPDAATDYRMALGFGSATGALCEARPMPPAAATATGGAIMVTASFCAGPKQLWTLSASGPSARDAGDPAFRQLMSDVVLALLPRIDPSNQGGSSGAGAGGGGGGM